MKSSGSDVNINAIESIICSGSVLTFPNNRRFARAWFVQISDVQNTSTMFIGPVGNGWTHPWCCCYILVVSMYTRVGVLRVVFETIRLPNLE